MIRIDDPNKLKIGKTSDREKASCDVKEDINSIRSKRKKEEVNTMKKILRKK